MSISEAVTKEPSNVASTSDDRGTAREFEERAGARARQTGEDTKQYLYDRAEEQRRAGATALRDVSTSIHGAADDLRSRNDARSARLVDVVADLCEDVGERLEHTDCKRMCRDSVQAMKRNPGVTIASAFALGLVAARFLRASEPETDEGLGRSQTDRRSSDTQTDDGAVAPGHTPSPTVHTTGVEPPAPRRTSIKPTT